MNIIRVASLVSVVALAFAPVPAAAQGPPPSGGASSNLQAQVEALTARLTALEGALTNETAVRAAAVIALQAALDAETAGRIAADITLQSNITTEATARTTRDTTLTTLINKLRGDLAIPADLVGTYRIAGTSINLVGGDPAKVEVISLTGTLTLTANFNGSDFTGSMSLTFHGINLQEGTPWTSSVLGPQTAGAPITWDTNFNGTVNVTDGTPALNINFNVGAGGRVWTFSGVTPEGTVDMVTLTRLL